MKILVLNGPNINMLGIREPGIYGKETFQDLLTLLTKTAEEMHIEIEQYQSNHEGCLVDKIQDYTHTNELALITLNFSQRPPDDLILRIGEVLEANENFINRREDRINITKESIRSLGIEKEESI